MGLCFPSGSSERNRIFRLADTHLPAFLMAVQGEHVIIKGYPFYILIKQLDIIMHQKDVFLVVLGLPLLDTRERYGNDLTGKLISNLVIQLFSYVAQTEREMNIVRTTEGIAAAKARGCGSVGNRWRSQKIMNLCSHSGGAEISRSVKPHDDWACCGLRSTSGYMSRR